jgi:hypothetical protein
VTVATGGFGVAGGGLPMRADAAGIVLGMSEGAVGPGLAVDPEPTQLPARSASSMTSEPSLTRWRDMQTVTPWSMRIRNK